MANTSAGRHDEGKSVCDLDKLAAMSTLPGSILSDLNAICQRKMLVAGETVAHAGDPSTSVGIVREGILRMEKILADGREHVVGLLIEGDIFGRLFDGPMHFAIEAATDAEIYTFRRSAFEAILLRSPELDRLLLLNLLNELDRARDWMIILAQPKIRGRLAGFLLLMCTRFQSIDHIITVTRQSIRVKIPINRPDLAHLLGTRVESVSRALHALADDGLLEILQHDLVLILDVEALTVEAGDTDLGDPASLQRLVRTLQKSSG